ncbi:MAG: hypothetical protein Q9171_003749 [Xanthocarpia ochracea]
MPFGNHIHNLFHHGHHRGGQNPTMPFGDQVSESYEQFHRREALKPNSPTANQDYAKDQKQSEPEAQRREREQIRKQQVEEKERKRQDLLDQRYYQECDRAREQERRNWEKRAEGKDFGHADRLGHDPLSDVRLVKHAVGYEVRKRMPGTRWKGSDLGW